MASDACFNRLKVFIVLLAPLSLLHAAFVGTGAASIDEDLPHPRIIFTDHTDLVAGLFHINGSGRQVYEENSQITAYAVKQGASTKFTVISFDYEDSRLAFSDTASKAIRGISLDETAPDEWVIYSGTSTNVNGLTVDWLANNTYWTNAVYHWIKVSNVNGSHYRSLITTDLDHPSGIACNPLTGYLYWSDIGRMNKIERSTLAGEERTLLLDENSHSADVIGRPISLAIDHSDNTLYWVDSLKSSIKSLDLNDENAVPFIIKQVVTSGNLLSLAVDPDFGFFVTDIGGNQIHIVSKDTTEATRSLNLLEFIPDGVTYYSNTNQPSQYAPCESAGCNQICVSDPAGYRCVCTYGHQLQTDNHTCEEDGTLLNDHEMIFSLEDNGGTSLCVFAPTVAYHPQPVYRCLYDVDMDHLDVDVYGLYVFVIEQFVSVAEIRRVRLEADQYWETIGYVPSSDVRGIAVDWIASNLYITNADSSAIEISSFDGRYLTTLVTGQLHQPSAIVVHAPKQYLFWTDTGPDPKIERADLSGRRDRHVLVDDGIVSPTHLTIDMQNDRIYWADGGSGVIESMDLDGKNRELFYNYTGLSDEPVFRFTGLAIFQELLFASEVGDIVRVFEIPNKSLVRALTFPNQITAMKFFHESLQPLGQGPCDVSNGNCDEICINTRYGAECVCSQPSCTTVSRCPLTISNGQLMDNCDNRNDHACDFTCNPGYRRATEEPVICTELGEWAIHSQDLCPVSRCFSGPCQNDGNCTDTNNGFNCTCLPNWQGVTCELEKTDTDPRTGGGGSATAIAVSVVMVALVIAILAVLGFVFRRKIFEIIGSNKSGDALYRSDLERVDAQNNLCEEEQPGVPAAPPASTPSAPAHRLSDAADGDSTLAVSHTAGDFSRPVSPLKPIADLVAKITNPLSPDPRSGENTPETDRGSGYENVPLRPNRPKPKGSDNVLMKNLASSDKDSIVVVE